MHPIHGIHDEGSVLVLTHRESEPPRTFRLPLGASGVAVTAPAFAGLLVLREVMHHLGYVGLVVRPPATTEP